MSDQDLFTENAQTPETQATKPEGQEGSANQSTPENQYADLLSGIKREDGTPKFKTVEEALRSIPHSQEFIGTLKNETAEYKNRLQGLEEEVSRFKTLEETVARLTANKEQQVEQGSQETPQKPNTVDDDAVKKMVESYLSSNKKQEQEQANLNAVQSTLYATYGDKAKEVVERKAQELGLSLPEMEAYAKANPKMVLAAFNQGAPKSSPANTSSVNLPNKPKDDTELPKPAKSLLIGATDADQKAHMLEIMEHVNKRLGVEK